MSFKHKNESHKQIHSLIDGTKDFKAKLEEFFGSELGTYQMKEVEGAIFYFNKRKDNWDNEFIRFSAVNKNSNENFHFDAYLDENFKTIDKFIDYDWCGYDWDDFTNRIIKAVNF